MLFARGFHKKRQAIVPILLGLAFTGSCAVAYIAQTEWMEQFFKRLDYLLYDIRYSLVPRLALADYQASADEGIQRSGQDDSTETPILIIDLDEESLSAQGRWPWSRHKMDALVAAVQASGVLMLGFDVLFAEPERNPVDQVLSRGQWPEAVRRSLLAQRSLQDADRVFAERLSSMETVLGFFWRTDEKGSTGQLPAPIVNVPDGRALSAPVISMPSYSANLPLFQEAAVGAGFLSAIPDADGVIRRVPLVVAHEKKLYGTLALEMARLLWFLDEAQIQTLEVNTRAGPETVIRGVRLGQYVLPTDAQAQILIPFLGQAGSFPYVSANDFLTGRVPAGRYDGYIAFLGTSALGLKDLRTTVVGTDYPGVEIHANLLQGILSLPKTPNYFAQRPDTARDVTFLWILCVGFFLSFVLPLLNPPSLLLTSFSVLVLSVSANGALWRYANLDFPMGPGLVIWFWLSLFYFLRAFLLVNFQRRRIREIFGQYVPEAHVESMLNASSNAGIEHSGLAGETKEMTVLFGDIRNFTSISEGLSAVELKKMLDSFFTPITEVIFDYEGTVDKYVGDMVMAFWGAPLPDAKHAYHAVVASLAILARVELLKAEFEARGLPKVDIGVGISTGQMHVGDMGSKFRRTYTVLGDAVNLGARLESLTKYYGVKLLVSEATQRACPEILFLMIDRIRVKGKSEPVQVYEPLCPLSQASVEQHRFVAEFHWFLCLYFSQRWDEAQALVSVWLSESPDNYLFNLYYQRITYLRTQKLGAHWDGVFTHNDK